MAPSALAMAITFSFSASVASAAVGAIRAKSLALRDWSSATAFHPGRLATRRLSRAICAVRRSRSS
nr:hypothetical protein [Magnetospirillum fulvum]